MEKKKQTKNLLKLFWGIFNFSLIQSKADECWMICLGIGVSRIIEIIALIHACVLVLLLWARHSFSPFSHFYYYSKRIVFFLNLNLIINESILIAQLKKKRKTFFPFSTIVSRVCVVHLQNQGNSTGLVYNFPNFVVWVCYQGRRPATFLLCIYILWIITSFLDFVFRVDSKTGAINWKLF